MGHGGCSERREVTFRQWGLQAPGKLPRAELQEGRSGFGNVEVGGKSPWVLTGMNNGLGGEVVQLSLRKSQKLRGWKLSDKN